MREAAKRPQYARRADRRVTDAAADEQRLQAQPAQADARHDAHHIPFLLSSFCEKSSPLAGSGRLTALPFPVKCGLAMVNTCFG